MPLQSLKSRRDRADRLMAAGEARAAGGATAAARWTPYPGPQTAALETPADELYFGGAASGGKSQLILGAALLQHRCTLILRRHSVDTQGLVDSLRTLMRPGDRWKHVGYGGELRTTDDRFVQLGGCQHEHDWQSYQGRAKDLLCLDELSHFTLNQYTMLGAWNRVADPVRHPGQRCRIISAGNPPMNPEGEWVLKRWAAWLDSTAGKKAAPGELRWFAQVAGKEEEFGTGETVFHAGKPVRPRSRTFIKSSVEDNPAMMATGYDAVLEAMPEPFRSQLRYGDFGVSADDHRWQLIPTAWVKASHLRWAALRDAPYGPLTAVGVDVAMSAKDGDATVLAMRHGNRVAPLVKRPGRQTQDGTAVVALIVAVLGGDAKAPVYVDAGSVGKSAVDAAKVAGLKNVVPVMFGAGTAYTDPTMRAYVFPNERAAMYWNLRNLLDPQGPAETRLALPPDPELTADLCVVRYEVRGDKIYIEPKESTSESRGIRARLGRSPDAGDAVALACKAPRKALWAMTG